MYDDYIKKVGQLRLPDEKLIYVKLSVSKLTDFWNNQKLISDFDYYLKIDCINR